MLRHSDCGGETRLSVEDLLEVRKDLGQVAPVSCTHRSGASVTGDRSRQGETERLSEALFHDGFSAFAVRDGSL